MGSPRFKIDFSDIMGSIWPTVLAVLLGLITAAKTAADAAAVSTETPFLQVLLYGVAGFLLTMAKDALIDKRPKAVKDREKQLKQARR